MNIEIQKIELVKLILNTDNTDILNSIMQIFAKSTQNDFWETLSPEQKEEVEAGLNDANNGNVVGYSEFMKKYR